MNNFRASIFALLLCLSLAAVSVHAQLDLAVETRQRGSAGGIAFSHDPVQRYLIIPDIQNNTIWILSRDDVEVVGRVGSAGDNGGQFHGLHMVDVDSQGNLYTGEVQSGERVQRFRLVP